MTISTGDVLLEVIGVPQAAALRQLGGVQCADVYARATLGDATVHLTLEPSVRFEDVRARLESSGVHVLAIKRVA